MKMIYRHLNKTQETEHKSKLPFEDKDGAYDLQLKQILEANQTHI